MRPARRVASPKRTRKRDGRILPLNSPARSGRYRAGAHHPPARLFSFRSCTFRKLSRDGARNGRCREVSWPRIQMEAETFLNLRALRNGMNVQGSTPSESSKGAGRGLAVALLVVGLVIG